MGEEHDITDIAGLRPGDHLCCLYETEEEHRALVTPYIRQGLERNEKVFYIVDAHTSEEILAYLRSDDLDVEAYLASGQLSILTRDDSYMREGIFDPDGMISLLRSETDLALEQGYACLRVTGEMTWALRGLPGSERLIEYEAKLNDFFPGSRAMAICQYDRRRFSPEILLEVLTTHPIAVIGTRIYPNFYFMPTEEFLQEDRSSATLAQWLGNLEERRRTEEALAENEERFRGLVEQSVTGIVLVDHQGRILEWNHAQEEITGIGREEALERYLWDIQFRLAVEEWRTPEALRQLKEMILSGLKTGEAPWLNCVVEQEIRRFDGTRGFLQTTTFPIRTSRGIVLASMSGDITERKAAEEALDESRERYKALFERSLDCVFIQDFQGGFLDANAAALDLLGYEREEIASLNFISLLSEDQIPKAFEGVREILETGMQQSPIELRLRRKDGEYVHVESIGSLIYREGEPYAVQGIARDITERVEREAKMEQMNADLQAFAHTLSHDLKTPLSSAYGYAATLKLLLTGKLYGREADALEVTIHSLESMDRIIDGMLQYASLDRPEGFIGEVDLDEVLNGILEELRGSGLLGENCRIETASLPTVTGDAARLRQVFYNLISNAAKFTTETKEPLIEVGMDETPEGRAVYVRDNGPGIRPEDLKRIFEPLARTDEAAVVPGHGLGLAIVKRAVRSWGGRVWVESEPGHGTTFYFTL